jgi:hypothetical protein
MSESTASRLQRFIEVERCSDRLNSEELRGNSRQRSMDGSGRGRLESLVPEIFVFVGSLIDASVLPTIRTVS